MPNGYKEYQALNVSMERIEGKTIRIEMMIFKHFPSMMYSNPPIYIHSTFIL